MTMNCCSVCDGFVGVDAAVGQETHIEIAATKIEDEDIALAPALLVETVRDGGGGGLADDARAVVQQFNTQACTSPQSLVYRGHRHVT